VQSYSPVELEVEVALPNSEDMRTISFMGPVDIVGGFRKEEEALERRLSVARRVKEEREREIAMEIENMDTGAKKEEEEVEGETSENVTAAATTMKTTVEVTSATGEGGVAVDHEEKKEETKEENVNEEEVVEKEKDMEVEVEVEEREKREQVTAIEEEVDVTSISISEDKLDEREKREQETTIEEEVDVTTISISEITVEENSSQEKIDVKTNSLGTSKDGNDNDKDKSDVIPDKSISATTRSEEIVMAEVAAKTTADALENRMTTTINDDDFEPSEEAIVKEEDDKVEHGILNLKENDSDSEDFVNPSLPLTTKEMEEVERRDDKDTHVKDKDDTPDIQGNGFESASIVETKIFRGDNNTVKKVLLPREEESDGDSLVMGEDMKMTVVGGDNDEGVASDDQEKNGSLINGDAETEENVYIDGKDQNNTHVEHVPHNEDGSTEIRISKEDVSLQNDLEKAGGGSAEVLMGEVTENVITDIVSNEKADTIKMDTTANNDLIMLQDEKKEEENGEVPWYEPQVAVSIENSSVSDEVSKPVPTNAGREEEEQGAGANLEYAPSAAAGNNGKNTTLSTSLEKKGTDVKTTTKSDDDNPHGNDDANTKFVSGMESFSSLLESVEVPDELDVGAGGSMSMQDVVISQSLTIVKRGAEGAIGAVRKIADKIGQALQRNKKNNSEEGKEKEENGGGDDIYNLLLSDVKSKKKKEETSVMEIKEKDITAIEKNPLRKVLKHVLEVFHNIFGEDEEDEDYGSIVDMRAFVEKNQATIARNIKGGANIGDMQRLQHQRVSSTNSFDTDGKNS